MAELRDSSQRDVEVNRPVLENPITGAEITRRIRNEGMQRGSVSALLVAVLLIVAGVIFLRSDAQPPDTGGQPTTKSAPNTP